MNTVSENAICTAQKRNIAKSAHEEWTKFIIAAGKIAREKRAVVNG